MAKNVVYKFAWYNLLLDMPLKKYSLLFDKIYIDDLAFKIRAGKNMTVPTDLSVQEKLNQNIAIIESLLEENIIKSYDSAKLDYPNDDESVSLFNQINSLEDQITEIFTTAKNTDEVGLKASRITTKKNDVFLRLDSLCLSKLHNEDFIPMIKSTTDTSLIKNKEKVINFVLNFIPEPDDSTSLEQILDFRKDEDVRLKYLALITWINEIAKSNYTIGEIKEKYEYLYLDYKRSYERHKIKSTFTTLELIAAAGAAFFMPNVPFALSLVSNFLKIGTSTMNLLKEEGTLPGKEIAYIYHANKKFTT